MNGSGESLGARDHKYQGANQVKKSLILPGGRTMFSFVPVLDPKVQGQGQVQAHPKIQSLHPEDIT